MAAQPSCRPVSAGSPLPEVPAARAVAAKEVSPATTPSGAPGTDTLANPGQGLLPRPAKLHEKLGAIVSPAGWVGRTRGAAPPCRWFFAPVPGFAPRPWCARLY